MNSILTVCIGNICRSPMAEGLLASFLPAAEVRSAGIGAILGSAADPIAVKLMNNKGIDISQHRALQINRSMCQKSNLILVMDQEQRKHIENVFPFVRGKVFLLTKDTRQGIPDPYRRGLNAFEEALALIEEGAIFWKERIEKIMKQEQQFT